MVSKKKIEISILLVLLLTTWIVSIFHLGTARSLDNQLKDTKPGKIRWIPKTEMGIHQLILEGKDAERGLASGQATRALLQQQEESLYREIERVFPNVLLRNGLLLVAMRWFYDLDRYIDSAMLEEMWGVSKSASPQFNFLADPYTRQVGYHALHEVGQSFVDMNPQGFACTLVGIPERGNWVLGRNFDFEGGRIFDEEKIMKWVYPEQGNAYLSVTWAGMVGVVTGVNAKGLYLSLNAAGTKDFRRVGTPTTLVLLKALQYANNIEEARNLIETAQTFITDIFILGQRGVPYVYRIEKSPRRYFTQKETAPFAVANHLVGEIFRGDAINEYRRSKMTSSVRLARAQELLEDRREKRETNLQVLEILRDHRSVGGKELPLGDRNAIDGLIATHSVIWDSRAGALFVSTGPSVSGQFIGFDLETSFADRMPVRTETLPPDPMVSREVYYHVHNERAVKEGRKP